MLRVGLEPTVLMFERAKTVHALDRAANVNGCILLNVQQCTCSSIYVWNILRKSHSSLMHCSVSVVNILALKFDVYEATEFSRDN
jgi:hypothetical protein